MKEEPIVSDLLVPPDPLVDRRNDIHDQYPPSCLPSPYTPLVPILNDPFHSDESIMKPIELKQDNKEQYDGTVDEEGIQRSLQSGRVTKECGLNRDAITRCQI